MTGPEPLKDILARLELYEPELGETLRQAPPRWPQRSP